MGQFAKETAHLRGNKAAFDEGYDRIFNKDKQMSEAIDSLFGPPEEAGALVPKQITNSAATIDPDHWQKKCQELEIRNTGHEMQLDHWKEKCQGLEIERQLDNESAKRRIDELEQQLSVATSALEFYAAKESWLYDKNTGIGGLIVAIDEWSDVPAAGAACFYPSYGGKRARQALKEIGGGK